MEADLWFRLLGFRLWFELFGLGFGFQLSGVVGFVLKGWFGVGGFHGCGAVCLV